MGLRGPPRRPEYLKVISGTQRASRPPEDAPAAADVVLVDAPTPPDWLPNKESTDEWIRVCALLVERGALDPLKLGPLGIYCATHGRIQQMYRAGTMPAAHMLAQYRSMARELGISDTSKPAAATGATPPDSRWKRIKQRATPPAE